VSVRTVAEAAIAAEGGADFIDLKEPRAGALGGLPVAVIADIVAALRTAGCSLPVSATIGDLPMHDLDAIVAQARAVAACGVDYVKVGIERDAGAPAVLQALSALHFAVVPVFIADRGLDLGLVASALHFPAVMADTADKLSGSLFDCVPAAELQQFVALARGQGALVGLAGALRHAHLPQLADLSPDFAGFRSAVCRGERGSALDAGLLRGLADALR
jgi:(5-formylfuran-3-yl)methyl phosphate synthase